MSHARRTCSMGWPKPRSIASENAATNSANRRPESRWLKSDAADRGWLSRLAGSNRVTKSSELSGSAFAASPGERVDRVGQLDVNEPGARDHCLPPCARQGT